MRSGRARAALVVGLAHVWACAGWQRVDAVPDSTLRPRQQVQVWQGGQVRVLHGVRVTADSVSGIPFHLPLICDTCRVALPRAQIDSLRVGDAEAPALSLAVVLTGLVALLYIWYAVGTNN